MLRTINWCCVQNQERPSNDRPHLSVGKQGLSYLRPERETLTRKASVWDHALGIIVLTGWAIFFIACGPAGIDPKRTCKFIRESPDTITVRPIEIEDVLYNPAWDSPISILVRKSSFPGRVSHPDRRLLSLDVDELEPSDGRTTSTWWITLSGRQQTGEKPSHSAS